MSHSDFIKFSNPMVFILIGLVLSVISSVAFIYKIRLSYEREALEQEDNESKKASLDAWKKKVSAVIKSANLLNAPIKFCTSLLASYYLLCVRLDLSHYVLIGSVIIALAQVMNRFIMVDREQYLSRAEK